MPKNIADQSNKTIKNKNIFVGFNTAGAAGIFAFTRVLKQKGYKIDFYGFPKENFNFPLDIELNVSKNPFISFFERFNCFLRMFSKYDIWHFNFANTLICYPLNLLILKIFGKKIVSTFRGSEARTGLEFLDRKKVQDYPQYYQELLKMPAYKRWNKKIRTAIFQFFSDKVIINGPFLANAVLNYDEIIPCGREIDPEILSMAKPVNPKSLTVLHIPSNPKVKGSDYVKKAFEKLAKKYPQHKFIASENMDHQDLLKEMAKADIVIDQLLIGWYGGQAVEAMMLGKPTMSFIYEPYLKLVQFAEELPIIKTTYQTFESDLEKLINLGNLEEIGGQSRKFAFKYHSAQIIADQYLAVYKEMTE